MSLRSRRGQPNGILANTVRRLTIEPKSDLTRRFEVIDEDTRSGRAWGRRRSAGVPGRASSIARAPLYAKAKMATMATMMMSSA
ncbi:MAG TPA: hypothetical protein DCY64_12430 [Hydrogenophaga sp.]|nr:MAG: hypothetical protein A2X73_14115 [Burkholderiales bacterium GWE1_65_30]OGA91963.1 MAG: hypothetical protein A2X72_15610 [Burkholderiales bacterium GWF1_66_17]HAX21075.1 hypothetical protein [Hydrogenophaga sp.]